jgi:ammonium transporter, Amt family
LRARGFAFLETGTVRHKNQVNALVKILVDFAVSTIAYFVIGYTVAYDVSFYSSAAAISGGTPGFECQGYTLVRFLFLCTFAAAVPAIVSGGIAERAKFAPEAVATATLVAVCYPFLAGIYWNKNFGLQEYFFKDLLGAEFKDFPGQLSSTPLAAVALGAVCGGIVVALIVGDNDPGFVDNGALVGLVAACAGSDVKHPLGALEVGGVAGAIFVQMFQISTNKWKLDDVLGVWALHGLCGLWGGIACGIFGMETLGCGRSDVRRAARRLVDRPLASRQGSLFAARSNLP